MKSNIKKPNDWFISVTYNDKMGFAHFEEAGLTEDNTQLKDKEFYKNNENIIKSFTSENGEFQENEFNEAYDFALKTFNDYVSGNYNTDYLKKIETTFSDYLRDDDTDVVSKSIKVVKLQNTFGDIEILGKKIPGKKSISELAQDSKIYDTSKNEFLDYSPNDEAGFTSIFKRWDNPLVLAQYDEDTEVINEYGERIKYKKGDLKLNEDGKFYYETLGNRESTGKRFLGAYDTITVDGSTLNKYDFLDGDDKEQAIGKALVRLGLKWAPIIAAGVATGGTSTLATAAIGFNKIYLGTTALMNLAEITPMLYKSVEGLITNESEYSNKSALWKQMDAFQAKNKTLSLGTSEYSQNKMFTWENMINMTSDVMLQLGQQRFIAGDIPKFLKLDKRYINNAVKAGNTPYEGLKNYNKFSKTLATYYMTLTSGSDAYNTAIESGHSERTAGLITLGTLVGLHQIMKSDIGQWGIKGLGLDDVRLSIKDGINKQSKQLLEANGGIINNLDIAGSDKIINKFANIVKSRITNISKNPNSALYGMLNESVEEVSEEMTQDVVFGLAKAAEALGITKKSDWKYEDAINRYAFAAMGGAIGGAMHSVNFRKENRNNLIKSLDQKEKNDLVELVYKYGADEITKQIEKEYDKKKLPASYTLSYDSETDSNGNPYFITSESIENTQAYILKEQLIGTVNLINESLKVTGINSLDQDILEILDVNEVDDLLQPIRSSGITDLIKNDLIEINSDILNITTELNSIPDAQKDSELVKTYQDKLIELKERKEALKSPDKLDDYFQYVLLANNDELLSNFIASNKQDLSIKLFNQSYNNLNNFDKNKIDKLYSQYKDTKITKIRTAVKILKNLNNLVDGDFIKYINDYKIPRLDFISKYDEIIKNKLDKLNNLLKSESDLKLSELSKDDITDFDINNPNVNVIGLMNYVREKQIEDGKEVEEITRENVFDKSLNFLLDAVNNYKDESGEFELTKELSNTVNDILEKTKNLYISKFQNNELSMSEEEFENFSEDVKDYDTYSEEEFKKLTTYREIIKRIEDKINKSIDNPVFDILEKISKFRNSESESLFTTLKNELIKLDKIDLNNYITSESSLQVLKDALLDIKLVKDLVGIRINNEGGSNYINLLNKYRELKNIPINGLTTIEHDDAVIINTDLSILELKIQSLIRIHEYNNADKLREQNKIGINLKYNQLITLRDFIEKTKILEHDDKINDLIEKLYNNLKNNEKITNELLIESESFLTNLEVEIYNYYKDLNNNKNLNQDEINKQIIDNILDGLILKYNNPISITETNTSDLNSNLNNKFTDYDKSVYLLNIISSDSSKFKFKLHECLNKIDKDGNKIFKYAPLASQEYPVRTAYGMRENIKLYNLFINSIDDPKSEKYPKLNNLLFIGGAAGIGKTSSILNLINLMFGGKIAISAITTDQAEKLKLELNSNKKAYSKKELLEQIRNGGGITEDVIIIDEFTHYGLISETESELEHLVNWANNNNKFLITTGDILQDGAEKNLEHYDKITTPYIEYSMRDGSILVKDNNTLIRSATKQINDLELKRVDDNNNQINYDEVRKLSGNIFNNFKKSTNFKYFQKDKEFAGTKIYNVEDYDNSVNEIVKDLIEIKTVKEIIQDGETQVVKEKPTLLIIKTGDVESLEKFNISELTDKFNISYADYDNVQGKEADYVVLLYNNYSNTHESMKTINTLLTRHKIGLMMISPSNKNLKFKNTKVGYNDFMNIPSELLNDFTQQRLEVLNEVIKDYSINDDGSKNDNDNNENDGSKNDNDKTDNDKTDNDENDNDGNDNDGNNNDGNKDDEDDNDENDEDSNEHDNKTKDDTSIAIKATASKQPVNVNLIEDTLIKYITETPNEESEITPIVNKNKNSTILYTNYISGKGNIIINKINYLLNDNNKNSLLLKKGILDNKDNSNEIKNIITKYNGYTNNNDDVQLIGFKLVSVHADHNNELNKLYENQFEIGNEYKNTNGKKIKKFDSYNKNTIHLICYEYKIKGQPHLITLGSVKSTTADSKPDNIKRIEKFQNIENKLKNGEKIIKHDIDPLNLELYSENSVYLIKKDSKHDLATLKLSTPYLKYSPVYIYTGHDVSSNRNEKLKSGDSYILVTSDITLKEEEIRGKYMKEMENNVSKKTVIPIKVDKPNINIRNFLNYIDTQILKDVSLHNSISPLIPIRILHAIYKYTSDTMKQNENKIEINLEQLKLKNILDGNVGIDTEKSELLIYELFKGVSETHSLNDASGNIIKFIRNNGIKPYTILLNIYDTFKGDNELFVKILTESGLFNNEKIYLTYSLKNKNENTDYTHAFEKAINVEEDGNITISGAIVGSQPFSFDFTNIKEETNDRTINEINNNPELLTTSDNIVDSFGKSIELNGEVTVKDNRLVIENENQTTKIDSSGNVDVISKIQIDNTKTDDTSKFENSEIVIFENLISMPTYVKFRNAYENLNDDQKERYKEWVDENC